jgi:hypothetical protein
VITANGEYTLVRDADRRFLARAHKPDIEELEEERAAVAPCWAESTREMR